MLVAMNKYQLILLAMGKFQMILVAMGKSLILINLLYKLYNFFGGRNKTLIP